MPDRPYIQGMASVRPAPKRSAATPSGGADLPDYLRELEDAADYLAEPQRQLLRRAWAIGASAHVGQTRKSGEPAPPDRLSQSDIEIFSNFLNRLKRVLAETEEGQ